MNSLYEWNFIYYILIKYVIELEKNHWKKEVRNLSLSI